MAEPLTLDQRGRVAEKIMEWGNLVFVGLVIAQIVPGPGFSWPVAISGLIIFAGAYFVAHRLMRGGQ